MANCGPDRLRTRLRFARARSLAKRAQAMMFLGRVHQVEEKCEGPYQIFHDVDRKRGDLGDEIRLYRVAGFATGNRDRADALDKLEVRLSPLFDENVPQELTEDPHIVAKLFDGDPKACHVYHSTRPSGSIRAAQVDRRPKNQRTTTVARIRPPRMLSAGVYQVVSRLGVTSWIGFGPAETVDAAVGAATRDIG